MLSMLQSGPLAVAGVFAIGLVIGVLVLTSAERSVLAVARAAARNISGCFWIGVLWQLLATPLLAVAVIACLITIIGILAIPFVVLAWMLLYAGAYTLGLLGVAIMIGRALAGAGPTSSQRGALLRGLIVGISLFAILWLGAALLAPVPVAGLLARLVALGITWAAATVGLGAVVTSQGGIARIRATVLRQEVAHTTPSWQTPTPMQGVVAAKRPTTPSAPEVW